MKKTGRNDPCPCGSNKKFKKCCEKKMIGKKFVANKLGDSALQSNATKTSGITSFFQNKIASVIPSKKKEEVENKSDDSKKDLNPADKKTEDQDKKENL